VLSQFKKLEQDLRAKGGIRWKHVMHMMRLLLSGIALLRDGELPVDVGTHRERLLAIRTGSLPWEEVEVWRQELHRDFDAAYRASRLPVRPDFEAANRWLLEARRSACKLPKPMVAVGDEHVPVPVGVAADPRLPAAADEQPHPLLFVTISGAHLYGFPSPDSDFDLLVRIRLGGLHGAGVG
jgi:hypothetical protein